MAAALSVLAVMAMPACRPSCQDACDVLSNCQDVVDPDGRAFAVHVACLTECEAEACEGSDSRARWIDCLAGIRCDSAQSAKNEIFDCGATCRAAAASASAVHLR